MEEKIIPAFPTYAITSTGFVRDLRTGTLKNGSNEAGYRVMHLHDAKNGVKHVRIHRLVAQAFIPNPDNLPEVDHIDRNPANNDVSNLRWVNDFAQAQNKGLQKNSKTGYKNIVLEDNFFRVMITRNGKRYFRKRYMKLEDAIEARDKLYHELGIV